MMQHYAVQSFALGRPGAAVGHLISWHLIETARPPFEQFALAAPDTGGPFDTVRSSGAHTETIFGRAAIYATDAKTRWRAEPPS